MSRVVIPDGKSFNAYHMLKLVSTYGEDVLENNVLQHVSDLFPDHHVIPFKKDISSAIATNITKKRPDLAMVDKDLKSWGVVEVEVAGHALDHVLQQVRVFASAKYNPIEVARYVKWQLEKHCGKHVAEKRIIKLLTDESPSVLVIVDEIKEDWRVELERAGAKLCTFEIYKSTRGRHLFRTAGRYPIIPTREAHVRRIPAAANILEVTSPFKFKLSKRQQTVVVTFDEIITEWAVVQDAGKLYLRFAGGANPLIGSDNYVIFADKRERYFFRRN